MRSFALFLLSLFSLTLHAAAIPSGQFENFDGGITQWDSAAQCCLSIGTGVSGNYLKYTSSTATTYKAVLYNNNASSIWNGDYSALTLLTVNAINFGPDALNLHLGVDNGGHVSSISAQALPADGQWHSLSWSLNPTNFLPSGALTNVLMLRFMSNFDGSFSGDLGHASWGIDNIQVFSVVPTATPTFSISPTSPPTSTRSSTPTPTNTSTPTQTATPSVTPSITQTWTASPTPSQTLTSTPTFSETLTGTPSASATTTPSMTVTSTESVTWTSSPTTTNTATISPTATFSPTPSASPTLAPWLRPGNTAEGTGPGLIQRGQPLCLAFTQAPPQLLVEIYNLRGERCIRWQDQPCGATASLSAGFYYLYFKSPDLERVQKLVIQP